MIQGDDEYTALVGSHCKALQNYIAVLDKQRGSRMSTEEHDALTRLHDAKNQLIEKLRAMLEGLSGSPNEAHDRLMKMAEDYGELIAICYTNGLQKQIAHLLPDKLKAESPVGGFQIPKFN